MLYHGIQCRSFRMLPRFATLVNSPASIVKVHMPCNYKFIFCPCKNVSWATEKNLRHFTTSCDASFHASSERPKVENDFIARVLGYGERSQFNSIYRPRSWKKRAISWDLRDVSRFMCSCFHIISSYVFFYLLRLEFSRWEHSTNIFLCSECQVFLRSWKILFFSSLFVSLLIPHWHISWCLPLNNDTARIFTISENLFQHSARGERERAPANENNRNQLCGGLNLDVDVSQTMANLWYLSWDFLSATINKLWNVSSPAYSIFVMPAFRC